MRNKLNNLEIDLPDRCLQEICTSGHNILAVLRWQNALNWDKLISFKEATQYCRESGISDVEKAKVKETALWLYAWYLFDREGE